MSIENYYGSLDSMYVEDDIMLVICVVVPLAVEMATLCEAICRSVNHVRCRYAPYTNKIRAYSQQTLTVLDWEDIHLHWYT